MGRRQQPIRILCPGALVGLVAALLLSGGLVLASGELPNPRRIDPLAEDGFSALLLTEPEIVQTLADPQEPPLLEPIHPFDEPPILSAAIGEPSAAVAPLSPLYAGPSVQETGGRVDLVPYAPNGWSYAVVPSSAPGTRTVNGLFAGQPTYIDWAVLNDSVFAVEERFHVHLYLDSERIASWYVDALKPGWYAHALDWVYTVTTPGWHTLRLVADPLDEVGESNELNNQWQERFYWQPSTQANLSPYRPPMWEAPLVASATQGTSHPSTLYAGQPTYIDWAIYNDSTVTVQERAYVLLYLDDQHIGTWYVDALLPSWQAYVRDWSYTVVEPGWHTLKLVIDPTDAVAESDERDNSWEVEWYWQATYEPNVRPYRPTAWDQPLVLSARRETTISSALMAGQPIYVDWAVINDSNLSVLTPFQTHLYLDGQRIAAWQTNTLSGQAYAYALDWSYIIAEPGLHTFTLVTDAASAIGESDEQDNTWEVEVLVQDWDERRVGIEWINDYWGTGLGSLMYNAINANGLYQELGRIGWQQIFDWGDASAWERDFKDPIYGGVDHQVLDNVTLAYFSGHSNRDGLLFGTYEDDNHLTHDEALWGNGSLNWLVADSCQVLNNDDGRCIERWQGAFGGLHMLLGFDTVCYDSPYRGLNLARYADGSYWWQSALPLKDAWFQAAAMTEDSDSYSAALVAIQPGIDPSEDYLPGIGTYSADPVAPTRFELWRVQN